MFTTFRMLSFFESVYEEALAVEFDLNKIHFNFIILSDVYN